MLTPPDDAPVVFAYSSGVNITFKGREESSLTWGEWRQMSEDERTDARTDFMWQQLDIDVWPVEDPDEDDE